jgi:hypothetical protein
MILYEYIKYLKHIPYVYIRTEFSEKTSLKTKKWFLKIGVKDIQAAAYNGARTVLPLIEN